MLDWIRARLAEPSTHAALAAMAAASIPLFGQYGTLAAVLFGLLGFGIAEKK
ncbi:MAG TPA: hypothetical protein VMU42_19495 [Candidatus Sulfotelmatobacter sp.]|nr:hypothetical protein [Candidatus Sulfotelmatobacter sp.]